MVFLRPLETMVRLGPDQNRPGGDLQVSQDLHHWGFVAYQIVPRGRCGTSARSNGTTSFSTASTSSIAPGSVSNRSLCCIFTAIWSVPLQPGNVVIRLEAKDIIPDISVHSNLDLYVRISHGKSVHVGEAKLAGTVCAPIGGLVFAFDDREGRVDIADVVAVGDAVEMEEHGVEP